MNLAHLAVTGGEKTSGHEEPMHGFSELYRALNSRDLELMRQNWSDSDEIAMDDPLGELSVGGRRFGPRTKAYSAARAPIGSSSTWWDASVGSWN